jgi:hemerythrin
MLKWNNTYKIGIDEIDMQHKKLFIIGDKLYGLITDDYKKDLFTDISSILKELSDYANYHFSYEEGILKKSNYPELLNQINEHKHFIKKLSSFDLYEMDENQQAYLTEIIKFVSGWIISHILKNDMRYKNHLLNNIYLF